MKVRSFTLAEVVLSNKILRTLRMTCSKGVNVFSLSKGEGQGEGFITNKVKELINKPSPAFVVFANAQTQLLPLTKREGNKKRNELINLSTYPPINFKKVAFTLAEVLITLGIIGVVAAMTIPTLITNYQKKQTVTKLKKVYSILNQAIKLSEEEFDSIESWDRDLTYIKFFNKYLRPHMNVSAVSKLGAYKDLPKYKRLDGMIENNFSMFRDNANLITLNDGCLLFISPDNYQINTASNPVAMTIGVDINGFSYPNVIGKDFFIYNIIIDYTEKFNLPKVVPYGSYGTSDYPFGEWKRENAINSQYYGCNKNNRGMFCLALIMIDNWQISSDYPW